MEYKEIVVLIEERWQRECLESIFCDEEIADIATDWDDKEYKMEVVLRRIIPGMKSDREEIKLFEYISGQSITEYVKEGWPSAYKTYLKKQKK